MCAVIRTPIHQLHVTHSVLRALPFLSQATPAQPVQPAPLALTAEQVRSSLELWHIAI